MTNYKIQGGTIVTMDSKGTVKDGVIIVENEEIIEVGKRNQLQRKYSASGYEKIDANEKVIIPGLINTHQHAAMSLLRGYADDIPLQEWLEQWIWPIEKHMTSHDIYVGALLTAVESVLGGSTTINTMYHYTRHGNEAQALAEVGLRAVVGHVCFSWRKDKDLRTLNTLVRDWHGKAGGLIRASVDPHAAYTDDPEYMRELRETTRKLNQRYCSQQIPIMWHTHVAETEDEPDKIKKALKVPVKGGVVEYLDSLGVLRKDVIAAHCVFLTPKDIDILRRRGVKVSHNPVSNLKLGSGISPVPKLLKAGVTVALGTDSSCSNNTADMFEAMRIAALLHKGVGRNPTLLPSEKVLQMATIEGAKALLWEKNIGSIEVGKDADLAIIDFRKPHLRPVYNEISHIVYSAKAADVETVLIKGKIIVENRRVRTVNVDNILRMAERTKERLLNKMQDKA